MLGVCAIFVIFMFISLYSLSCMDKVNISPNSSFAHIAANQHVNAQAGIAPPDPYLRESLTV